jgi:hypothetical protein
MMPLIEHVLSEAPTRRSKISKMVLGSEETESNVDAFDPAAPTLSLLQSYARGFGSRRASMLRGSLAVL